MELGKWKRWYRIELAGMRWRMEELGKAAEKSKLGLIWEPWTVQIVVTKKRFLKKFVVGS